MDAARVEATDGSVVIYDEGGHDEANAALMVALRNRAPALLELWRAARIASSPRLMPMDRLHATAAMDDTLRALDGDVTADFADDSARPSLTARTSSAVLVTGSSARTSASIAARCPVAFGAYGCTEATCFTADAERRGFFGPRIFMRHKLIF